MIRTISNKERAMGLLRIIMIKQSKSCDKLKELSVDLHCTSFDMAFCADAEDIDGYTKYKAKFEELKEEFEIEDETNKDIALLIESLVEYIENH